MSAALIAAFDAAMLRLADFGPRPCLAVAVSGGADSLALALLADDWARRRQGSIMALIVDHGLRPASAGEALATAELLAARRVPSRIISLGLAPGAAIQERARRARHAALARAAREAGAIHLLLGHHWRDQVETLAMRAARGNRGRAGMAAVVAQADIVMIRPLLHVEPECLREFLRREGCGWIEDPSNLDRRFERARIRAMGHAAGIDAVDQRAAGHAGRTRHEEMRETARQLAHHAEIHPEGYALLRGAAIAPEVLANLLRVIGGRSYPPDRQAIARLAERLRPASLGGVQLVGWRATWLFAREPASCAEPVALEKGLVWDGRFRIGALATEVQSGSRRVGALGAYAAKFRKFSDLPSLILRTLPAVYDHGTIIAVPHLGYGPLCRLDFPPTGSRSADSLCSTPFCV